MLSELLGMHAGLLKMHPIPGAVLPEGLRRCCAPAIAVRVLLSQIVLLFILLDSLDLLHTIRNI